ncbi:MAG: ferrochelatase [Actinomycetia bacterium]|nr:ferrochelatase [Actinomycetes bacterium]
MANHCVENAFDALLFVSFGGPEGPDEVVPFLQNVTRGRGIPDERLREVGQHYFHFGGVSPISGQNREFLARLREELPKQGIDLPVYWGNRNWSPYLVDALEQMRADGVKRALAFFTSAYSSYSGCRQYRENLAAALSTVGGDGPTIERLGPYFNHAGFLAPFADATVEAVRNLTEAEQSTARLVFTTHSIPESMADSSGPATGLPGGSYVQQHREVAGYVASQVRAATGVDLPWDLVYQSRSGAPHIPWLEPDIDDHLRALAGDACTAAVVVPIGFVSDHMEVLWDLDTQARATADEVGLLMVRVATPGADPRMVSMVGELVRERLEGISPERRPRVGALAASPDRCAAGCCPNPRSPLPAVAGSDPVPAL